MDLIYHILDTRILLASNLMLLHISLQIVWATVSDGFTNKDLSFR